MSASSTALQVTAAAPCAYDTRGHTDALDSLTALVATSSIAPRPPSTALVIGDDNEILGTGSNGVTLEFPEWHPDADATDEYGVTGQLSTGMMRTRPMNTHTSAFRNSRSSSTVLAGQIVTGTSSSSRMMPGHDERALETSMPSDLRTSAAGRTGILGKYALLETDADPPLGVVRLRAAGVEDTTGAPPVRSGRTALTGQP